MILNSVSVHLIRKVTSFRQSKNALEGGLGLELGLWQELGLV